jgi:hypothetical protein
MSTVSGMGRVAKVGDKRRLNDQRSASGGRCSVIGNRRSAIGNRQSAIGNRQSAISDQRSAIGDLAVRNEQTPPRV